MAKMKLTAFLLVSFGIGCAASQLRAQVSIPHVRPGTAPPRWEYACVRATENITELANKFGAEGWEMSAAAGAGWGTGLQADHTMIWCFKRPLPQ